MEPTPTQKQMPDNAEKSPDGLYWLDTDINDWRPVPGGAADTGGQSNDPRVQARLAAGLPAEKNAASDEQRAQYAGESTIGHESLAYSELEVPEINEHEAGEHEEEQTS